MTTRRIYREDRYAAANEAVVTGVRCEGGRDVIACSASVFYPEGGGQPSDTGTVSCAAGVFAITYVSDESLDGDVWHATDAPAGTFNVGDIISLKIDWSRRFTNMQRHLGEHMLSGAMHTLFGGVNRGFHMGEEYITIDIDLDGRMLTQEELELAESKVNEAIWANLPVTITEFGNYEASLALPVRKAVPHDGWVYVVTVGDPDDPFDCIACCGTHPSRSSEVGLVSIYKCEPNKGMNRIFFDCGSKAFKKLSADSRLLSDIAKNNSCSPQDLPARLALEADNASALRVRVSALAEHVKEGEKQKILSEIADLRKAAQEINFTYTYRSDLLSTDELLKLGFSVVNEAKGLLLLLEHIPTHTCLLFSSGDADCGALIKEHAKEFGGRGGGRPDNARAVFQDRKAMKSFVERITSTH